MQLDFSLILDMFLYCPVGLAQKGDTQNKLLWWQKIARKHLGKALESIFLFTMFYCSKKGKQTPLLHPLFPHSQLFWSHSSGRVRPSHQGKHWQDPCRNEAILNRCNHLKARKKKMEKKK